MTHIKTLDELRESFRGKYHLGNESFTEEVIIWWLERIKERDEALREGLEMAIIGCKWCDLENGEGRYVNVRQLSQNILSILKQE